MTLTFRAKLMLIVGAGMLSLLLVMLASTWIGLGQSRDLVEIENHMVPLLELGPQVAADFEQLRRSMQDAVAAQDVAALDTSGAAKRRLLGHLENARSALDPAAVADVQRALDVYHERALDVSRRLIAGETGEALVEEIAEMQAKQAELERLIERTVALDRSALKGAFAALRGANERADRLRLAIGLSGLLLVLGMSIWFSRSMLQALRHLSSGFARFSTGDFAQAIPVASNDDLGKLAREANQMARNLQRLADERDRRDWVKAGQVGLSNELRGELDPEDMAALALKFLVEKTRAVAGALYLRDEAGLLERSACVALAPQTLCETPSEAEGAAGAKFAPGEGLVGQAALADDLVIVNDLPPGYMKLISGLGEAPPRTLVLLPLARRGRTVGVVELAMFETCSEAVQEFLRSVAETLTMAFETSTSRQELQELLAESRRQADRLVAQEEELRVNNNELLAQQEELSMANQELEAQRRALRENNESLEAVRQGLQEKAEELARVSSYKSQFLANMSHELRTPLNSMLLLSHLLAENEDRNLSPKQVEHCRTIHSAGEDLLKLINQILDLAKIEAGRQELHFETVPLAHFALFARRRFQELASERGLALNVDLAPDLPEGLTTDVHRLERILTNLLGNAIKFTKAGSVSLTVRRASQGARFQRRDLAPANTLAFVVADTGLGIPDEARERVFAPFEQVETASGRSYGGTGLGLAIARESALLLGGELHLESIAGEGSTFTCYVPETPPSKIRSSHPAKASKKTVPAAAHSRPVSLAEPQLLIIEDDPVLAEQLGDIIRARRLSVLQANTGEAGLRLARSQSVIGIILDVRLPDTDGWAVMERLKSDPVTRDIPVHFVSAVDKPERGLALGAVGYLVKPVTHAELTSMVFTLTRDHDGVRPKLLIVEDNDKEGQSIATVLRGEPIDVTHVTSADSALAALETESFGCMILDLGLPDMDGLKLLEKLKSRAGRRFPRIVVHTGRALTKQEARQLEAYAEAVILKDEHSGERLLEEVRSFVRHLKQKLPKGLPAPELVSPVSQPDISLADKKILLAEDDMRTVYALSALMIGKGAEVVVAENGREALELLARHSDVHAVLMDIMMPEMDGYEAIRRLRAQAPFADLPVIALTARAMKGERERCLEAGASDYLTKPVDPDRLLGVLHQWLTREAAVVTQ